MTFRALGHTPAGWRVDNSALLNCRHALAVCFVPAVGTIRFYADGERGAERRSCWTLRKEDEHGIVAAEMRCTRKRAGINRDRESKVKISHENECIVFSTELRF